MSRVKCIGLVVEDESDYESSKKIIQRITKNYDLKFKKAISNGCGKLRRKLFDYAVDLNNRGCDTLIVIHDLDRNNLNELKNDLETKLKNSPLIRRFLCIPIEELEAWFLSDPDGIKKYFNLKRKPKIKGNPETIISPKEKLGEIIYHCSEKNLHYLNTKHNQLLSGVLSLELVFQKCSSFRLLYAFLVNQKYN